MMQANLSSIRHSSDLCARLRELEEILDPFYEELLSDSFPPKRIQVERFITIFSILQDMRWYLSKNDEGFIPSPSFHF